MRTVHRVAVTTRTSIERKVVKQILKILLLFIFFLVNKFLPLSKIKKPMGFLGGRLFRFGYSLHQKPLRNSEDLCWTFTCDRDEKRKKTDPSFKPSDAPKRGRKGEVLRVLGVGVSKLDLTYLTPGWPRVGKG